MSDKKQTVIAKKAYELLCRTIDGIGWEYEKEDDGLCVHFGVEGKDISIYFIIVTDIERQLVRLMAPIPVILSESKRIEVAVALCHTNLGLPDGSFDIDLSEGKVGFRMAASIRESSIGKGLFQYMLEYTCVVMEKYGRKILALEKGDISLDEFMEEK
ncbi:MAG: hypothetical protein IJA52_02365 [Clostridia bacterium]|nr:hypothetical protein [Clostridia bacterium]